MSPPPSNVADVPLDSDRVNVVVGLHKHTLSCVGKNPHPDPNQRQCRYAFKRAVHQSISIVRLLPNVADDGSLDEPIQTTPDLLAPPVIVQAEVGDNPLLEGDDRIIVIEIARRNAREARQTPINEILSCISRCNNFLDIAFSPEVAKVLMIYVAKYLVKNPVALGITLALIQHQ